MHVDKLIAAAGLTVAAPTPRPHDEDGRGSAATLQVASRDGGTSARRSVRLVAIGTGAPGVARAVLRELGLQDRWTAFVDPARAAYRAIGAHRGVLATFMFKRWDNLLGLLLFPIQCCCKRRLPQVNAGEQRSTMLQAFSAQGPVLHSKTCTSLHASRGMILRASALLNARRRRSMATRRRSGGRTRRGGGALCTPRDKPGLSSR